MTKRIDRRVWNEYKAEPGADFVPVEVWGKDHWSTLAYLECRAIDGDGDVDNRKMRTHPRIHRELVGITMGHIQDGSAHPTITKTGELEKHDDWSCIEDMVAAGYLRAWFRDARRHAFEIFGGSRACIRFTPRGLEVAAALRAHKAMGGVFATFALPAPLLTEAAV